MPLSRFLASLFFLFTSVGLRCEVLLDDPFTDGNRSNASGGDAAGAVWYQSTAAIGAVTVVEDTAGLGSGNALRLATTVDFHKLLAFFPARSLAATGDAIRVTFDYRVVSPMNYTGAASFRVGLGYSNGSRQSSDTASTASTVTRTDDKNYGFNTDPLRADGGLTLCSETAGSDILSGSDRVNFPTSARPAWDATSQKHSALLQIARQANGDVTLKARIDNQVTAIATQSTPVPTYIFDEFAFGFSGDPGYRPVILVDNVRVETSALTLLNITATNANASEVGLNPAVFTVTRSNAASTLSVPFTLGGTAQSGSDYLASGVNYLASGTDYQPDSGVVNFAAGQASATITITPKSDYFVEGNESVTVSLVEPDACLSQTDSATAVVTDDAAATIVNDRDFFAAMDLTRTGLSAVKTAVDAATTSGNFTAAKSALATYFRTRTTPAFPLTPTVDTTFDVQNNAVNKTYTIVGQTYTFPTTNPLTINWSKNPTSPINNEWPWQLNRHAWWDDLTDSGVSASGAVTNSSYFNEFKFELKDWIANSPCPENPSDFYTGTSRWRPLDAGIRMQLSWPCAFERVRRMSATLFDDALLVLWVKSFYMHAQFLHKNPTEHGNVCTNESQGLYNIGAVFQEFKDAALWRDAAVQRVTNVMNNDVFADGSESELSPSYHDVIVKNIEGIKVVASAYGLSTSAVFDSTLERMYNYQLLVSEPARSIPRINDSTGDMNDMSPGGMNLVTRMMGAFNATGNTSFQWLATDGAEGTMPSVTSHLFADAGQAVMRSGWSRTDSYLLMDAGPFGSGHQHEDKLSINVDGYGVRHIIDCGPYNYDTSPYRPASLLSHANSQPIIDDLDQNRGANTNQATWTNRQAITWHTSATFDYASAQYGTDDTERWGPDAALVRPAVTTRHIFFVKPDIFWVVIDAFKALDTGTHKYTGLFNCSDQSVETNAATQRVTVQLKAGEFDPQALANVTVTKPSLTITPLVSGNQTLSIVSGQDAPNRIMGWQFYMNRRSYEKLAIPTVRYDRITAGDTQMAYVLSAATATAVPRTPTVTAVATAPGTYGVRVSYGQPGDAQTFLVSLNGSSIAWNGVTYACPSIIAMDDGTVFVSSNGDTVAPVVAEPSGGFAPLKLRVTGTGTIALPDYRAQAVASDNRGVVRFVQSPAPGTALSAGVTRVTLTAYDAEGNQGRVGFDVGVNIVASDPFTDGSRSNTLGGDTLGLVWWQGTTPGNVTVVDDSAGIGSGNALRLAPTVDYHKLLAFFPKTTLASTGDFIRVAFDYRFETAQPSKPDGLRVCLGYSAGTRQGRDTGGGNITNSETRYDDVNYGFATNPGSTSNTGTVVKYEAAGDDILGGSAPGSFLTLGTDSGSSVSSDTAKHSAVLTLTRQANGDLLVEASVDGGNSAKATHAAASRLTYDFDEFAIGLGGANYKPVILVDNVVVSARAFDNTPYLSWRSTRFGAQATDTTIAGDLADPNGNGLSNLLEYALGGDPLATNAPSVAPTISTDTSARLRLQFTRNPMLTDITLTVQGADSPAGPWTDLARSTAGGAFAPLQTGVQVAEPASGATRNVTVTDLYAVTATANPRRFLRLSVVR